MLAGAGKSLIDRSNGCTFVIGSVQQRPTKIHLGNVGLERADCRSMSQLIPEDSTDKGIDR